ncbi:MAG: TPM domain-containing protein [Leptospirales bacterium]|nr:TPM domain-containing protein [Leptospirales bacterium]
MKHFILFLFALLLHCETNTKSEIEERISAIPNPRPQGSWVADPAGILKSRVTEIDSLIQAFERETTGEIAIVVLPSIGQIPPKEFATKLFEVWGIGKKGKDNGILVLHVLDQRRVEIETGYGMEGSVPDIACSRIVDDIAIPFFKKGSYADGHLEVTRALIRAAKTDSKDLAALTTDLKTKPGESVQAIPAMAERDSIERRHAPLYMQIVQNIFLQGFTLLASLALLVRIVLLYRKRKTGVATKDYEIYAETHSSGYLAMVGFAIFAGLVEFSAKMTLWIAGPLLPGLLIAWFAFTMFQNTRIRSKPRICPKCAKKMRRASYEERPKYLSEQEQFRQGTGKGDYDVWLCECGHVSKEIYKAVVYDYSDSGPTTPTNTTSSSNSSGGSSSSGGSWGGGRSGGGGAGGSY